MRVLIFTITFFLALSLNAQIAEPNFITLGMSGPHSIADMDNDGDLDVVASNTLSDSDRQLVWYENTDNLGTTWATHDIDVSALNTRTTHSKAIDVTGDGWTDIVLGTGYTLVHNGNASNVGFEIIETNTGTSSSAFHAFGDVNGDGIIDALRFNPSPEVFTRFLNTAQDGTFSDPMPAIPLAIDTFKRTESVRLVDFDSDNDLDVFVSVADILNQTYHILWYENTDGLGNFSAPNILETGDLSGLNNYSYELEAGHFNNDNLIDFAISKKDSINIYFQQANNIWTPQLLVGGTNTLGGSLAAYDFDNDGDLDLLEGQTIINTNHQSFWYENIDNNGTFNQNGYLDSIGASGTRTYSLGDFDNDGDIDFTFHNSNSSATNGIFLFKNNLNTIGTFNEQTKVSDNINGYLEPFPVDLDNDQDQDIIFFSSIEHDIYWQENTDGFGNFSTPIPLIVGEQIEQVSVNDLDNDGDSDIIVINRLYELAWYENTSTSTISFGPKQIIQTVVDIFNGFIIGDFDNDGDLDISAHNEFNDFLYWYEQTAVNSFTAHLVSDESPIFQVAGFADVDNDGLKDILCRVSNSNNEHLNYYKQEPDGSFNNIIIEEDRAFHVKVVDFENDSDDDIVYLFYDSQNSEIRTKILINTPGGFESSVITNSEYFIVVDVDNDGEKDIYNGVGWYKQIDHPSNFSNFQLLHPDGRTNGELAMSDLDGNGIKDFIFSLDRDELVWAENLLNEGSWIEGQVAIDQDQDCILTSTDSLDLYGWTLEFEHNNNTYYSSTNINGQYLAFLPDSGDYVVSLDFPSNYWTSCYNDILITGVSPDSPAYLDFPVEAVHDCPLMQIDVGSSNFRPCIDGSLYVQFCNTGTIPTVDATVEVVLAPSLNFNTANYPFTTTDSSLIFEIGIVDPLECGNISLNTTTDCDSTEVGDILCTNVYVTPDSLCAPQNDLWDGSTIAVNGFCLNDSIHFQLKNVGDGAMSEARMFRIEIVNDDIVLMIEADTFDLDPDETKWVHIEAEMDALRLEADQDENHPVLATASTIVDECADFEFTVNLFPNNDGDFFSEQYCRTVTGSYDPNIKEVTPTGQGAEHFIDRSWNLDYTIHFQNTGNDTAFTVVVKDSISEQLDLSTLSVGGGSHPFTWKLTTQRELIFTFNNILLPDSTTNEPASHGYFNFSINPNEDVPFETLIQNRAAIFFDFNDPIITNQVNQTIRTPIIANSFHFDICAGEETQGIPIFNDTLIVDSTFITEGLQLDFLHIHVIPSSLVAIDTSLLVGTIFNNIEITQDTIIETLFESSLGCDSLVIYTISTTTNIFDLGDQYGFKVYPVPSENEVLLSWNTTAPTLLSFSLIATDGQKLNQVDLKNISQDANSLNINLEPYPRGVYWLKIDLEGGSVYRRVVKL